MQCDDALPPDPKDGWRMSPPNEYGAWLWRRAQTCGECGADKWLEGSTEVVSAPGLNLLQVRPGTFVTPDLFRPPGDGPIWWKKKPTNP